MRAYLGVFLETLFMSPLRKQAIFTKRVILDEIFIFRDSVMLEYQLIEKDGNIAKRYFFDFACFRSGLIYNISNNLVWLMGSIMLLLKYQGNQHLTWPVG